jgi:carboxypeptidase Q
VKVPRWVRGRESLRVVSPRPRELPMLGLGMSVGTPPGGVTAPVVVVRDEAELLALAPDGARGKIVVFAHQWEGYGRTVRFRSSGASDAAKLGAVAALVRSATGRSIASPHTGSLTYAEGVPKIPAAAITVEDAEWLRRVTAKGERVTLKLQMEARLEGEADSANVIAEIRGRELPDEVVVVGAHFDSWDVGQGAHDDGCASVAAWQALHLLKQMDLRPRRTLRVVLFTNEENGLRGGKGYAKDHEAELPRTVLAVESDSGGFAPRGFDTGAKDPEAARHLRANVTDIASLLRQIGVRKVGDGHGGSDIGPMEPAGVPQVGLDVDNRTYFDIHHTEADTLDKVDPKQLADDVAAVAVLAFIAADLPTRLDQ